MTTISNPDQILNILQAAAKPLNSREIFARAKGFETADDVSKTLNYMLKKGVVEREKTGVNTYSYWPASTATAHASDSGNTLLRHGGEEPMPDQSEQSLAMVPASAAQQIINDALKPCPEIDATTQAMADQAEQAYEILAAALGKTPHDLCELNLTDLADAAASQLGELTTESREQFRLRATAEETLGNAINQLARTLDIQPGATMADILAEVENISRLADRASQIGARDTVNGPYVVITHVHSGEINDMAIARKKAELVAQSSTSGQAAVAQIIASVTLTPKWSDAA